MPTLACAMCNVEGPQVRPRMVEWLEPIGNTRWEVLPMCVNSRECRERVKQLGDEWPFVETSADRIPA